MSPDKLAAQLIDEYCIEGPKELNVEEIANAERLFVVERPLKNFIGMINYKQDYGLITVSSLITGKTQKIFTITHEMGHYFNERHKPEHLRGCNAEDLSSYRSDQRNEENANVFAAELLMHRPWFNDFINKRELNFELIKEAAEYFNVSLSAAAFRYVQIGKYPSAIVYSKDGVVKWSAMHDYFPFKFLRIGTRLHKATAAYDFFAGRTMQTCFDLIPATCWFPEDNKCKQSTYLYEQNVAMPSYNAVLTLLWPSEYF